MNHLSDANDARHHLVALLEHEQLAPADAQWLVSPGGLVAACRDGVRSGALDFLEDGRFASVLAELDEHVAVSPSMLPGRRAEAIVALAQIVGASAPAGALETVVRGFAPRGRPPPVVPCECQGLPELTDALWPLLVANPWLAGVVELAATLLRDDVVPTPARTVVVATSRHNVGELLTVVVTAPPAAEGVSPDYAAAPFLRCDDAFAASIETAVRAAGSTRRGVRWHVVSARSGRLVDAVEGSSAGLGAALAVRRLDHEALAPLDPMWVFTGRVDADGTVGTLASHRSGQDYLNKLAACADRTLVVPESDSLSVSRLVESNGLPVRIQSARTVGSTESLVARHFEARLQYERTLRGEAFAPANGERVPAPSRRRVAMVVAGLCLVGAWVLANHLRAERAAERAVELGWGRSAEVEVGGTELAVQTSEVSNAQWAACMQAGPCRAIPLYDATAVEFAHLPARGVSGVQAAAFCEWVKGALPTLEQWQSLVKAESAGEYPVTAMTLQPVRSELLDPDEFSNLVGNVTEWTRTTCDSGPCGEWKDGDPPDSLEVVGLPFDSSGERAVDDASAATDEHVAADADSETNAPTNVGLRCIRLTT